MVVLTIIVYCFEISTVVIDVDINLEEDRFRKRFVTEQVNGYVNDNSEIDIVFIKIEINVVADSQVV